MYSKRNIKFIIVILSFLCVLIISISILSYNNELQTYEYTWNIQLPSKMVCLYKWNNQDSFHGDGTRYSKYKVLETDSDIFDNYNVTKNRTLETFICHLMVEIHIPTEERFEFTSSYQWKYLEQEQDNIFIIYFPNTKDLFLIQNTA